MDKKKLRLTLADNDANDTEIALLHAIEDTNDEVESVKEGLDTLAENVNGGFEQVFEAIENIELQKGDPGDDGKDYVLTDEDKKEIASKIKVPVVEKVIEKTTEIVKEKPIVKTEIVKETVKELDEDALKKSLPKYGITIKEALESLEGDDRLDFYSFRGWEKVQEENLQIAIDTLYRRTQFLINRGNTSSVGGGSTNPSGSTGDVQFNTDGAFDSDSGNFFWDKTNHRSITKGSVNSEKVASGDFSSGLGWVTTSGWTVSGGIATHGSNGTGTLSQSASVMTTRPEPGRLHVFTYTISGLTTGSVTPTIAGTALQTRSADGTYTEYFVPTNVSLGIVFTPTNTARFSIDNVSLKTASGGENYSGSSFWGTAFYSALNNTGTASGIGMMLNASTLATAGNLQYSPAIYWRANGWNTSSLLSIPVSFRAFSDAQSHIIGRGSWNLQVANSNLDGTLTAGTWTTLFSIDNRGQITHTLTTDGLAGSAQSYTMTGFNHSNSTPGVTSVMSFNNSGSNTFLDFKFSGTLKSTLGVDSNGNIFYYAGSGATHNFYVNPTSATNIFQIGNGYVSGNGYATFAGYGLFRDGVHAGSQGTPPSTLTSQGGTGLKVSLRTTSATLDNSETNVLVDASNYTVCTGTTSVACSTYTSQINCEARDSHGGCIWATNSCSTYNGTDSSTCTSGHSGCTWESTPCSGAGDQSSCEVQDDAYGGSCSWIVCSGYGDSSSCTGAGCTWGNCSNCTDFNGNQSNCETTSGCSWDTASCSGFDETTCGSTSGCTQNYDMCSNYNDGGFDGSACNAANGGSFCSYDMFTGACSGGSWYISCSGTYNPGTCSGVYNCSCGGSDHCTGTYNTGNCTGSWGSCIGTASCSGIDDQTNCNNETGCSWQTAINITMPATSAVLIREYRIKNIGLTGSVYLLPNSGQTIEFASSFPLLSYKDSAVFAFYQRTYSCSSFATQTPCEAQSGCTWNTAIVCSGYGTQVDCENQSGCGCTWDGVACSGAGCAASCTGSYTTQNWYEMSEKKQREGITTKSTNYTLLDSDYTVIVTSSGTTQTLPTATGRTNRIFTIKAKHTSGNTTVACNGSETIFTTSAVTTVTLAAGNSIDVQSDGTNWIRI